MGDKVEPFVVGNPGNTCYIDSLLMGLFFSPSTNDYLLRKDTADGLGLYLQEIIKIDFVDQVRNFKSVKGDTMDFIRGYCHQMGWKSNNPEELFNQQDVTEFYIFLMDKFEGTQIKFQRETFTEALKSDDDIGKETYIPYIPLAMPTDKKIVKIRDMLNEWINDNVKEVKRFVITDNGKEEKMVMGLDVKRIVNTAPIIAIGINRFQNIIDKNGEFKIQRNNTDIIIQKKISPFHEYNDGLNKRDWIFHAAICHKGDTVESGHYYCLLRHNDKYYIFDDAKIPCIDEVETKTNKEMSDEEKKYVTEVVDKIKKDCVFILYRFVG